MSGIPYTIIGQFNSDGELIVNDERLGGRVVFKPCNGDLRLPPGSKVGGEPTRFVDTDPMTLLSGEGGNIV